MDVELFIESGQFGVDYFELVRDSEILMVSMAARPISMIHSYFWNPLIGHFL